MNKDDPPRRRPTHVVCYLVGDGDNTSAIPAGAAWANEDGEGFLIQLEAVPLSGVLTMQPHNPETSPKVLM